MKKLSLFYIAVSLLLLSGCVGTDLINEASVDTEDGYIVITAEKQSVQINESITLTGTTYNASDNPVNNEGIRWTSSDESIISIDNNGILTGISVGQASVTASAQGFAEATVMISAFADPNAIASIDVTPTQAELEIGGTVMMIAVAKNGIGETIDNITFAWNSTSPNVASVNSNGLVTAMQAGSTNISASSGNIRSQDIQVNVRSATNSKMGTFVNNPGTSYSLSGIAELIQENKNLLLKFGDDFSSSDGPGLYVYLSPTQSVSAGSVELGELKSTTGAQEYNLNNRSMDEFDYVIIHCKPFNVSFGWARLN